MSLDLISRIGYRWIGNNLSPEEKILEGELESYLRKKHLFRKNFDQSIAKFSLLHGLRAIKYNSKIFNIYYHIKCRKSRKNIMNICSTKKLFLKILGYSQEDTCVGVSFLITLQAFSHAILLKRDLQHRCLPVNIAQFLRTPVLKNTCELIFERFPTWSKNIASNIGNEEEIFSKKIIIII